LDFYDFLVYGSLVSVLAVDFFPPGNSYVAIMSTLAVFGVGFVARPVGGIIFGRMGDLVGRKRTFIVTILIVGVSTALMGLLPTYQSVGMLATAFLVILRLTQGLGLGGEYSTSGTFVSEFSSDRQRGLNMAFSQHLSLSAGALLGLGVIFWLSSALGTAGVASYGWRIAFLLSLVLLAVGLVMRVKLTETPAFRELREAHMLSKGPVSEAIKMNWKTMVKMVLGAQAGISVIYYTATSTGPIIVMTTIMKPPVNLALASQVATIGILISLPFYPLFGWLSDRIQSRKKVMYPGMLASAITLYPLYYLVGLGKDTGNIVMMISGVAIMAIISTAATGLGGVFWAETFPTRVRNTSYGIANNLGSAIFGGFAPFVLAAIVNAAGGQLFAGLLWPIAVPIVAVIIGGLGLRETHCKLATAAVPVS
jgi:MFS family permease